MIINYYTLYDEYDDVNILIKFNIIYKYIIYIIVRYSTKWMTVRRACRTTPHHITYLY